jgi:hypothetical protein
VLEEIKVPKRVILSELELTQIRLKSLIGCLVELIIPGVGFALVPFGDPKISTSKECCFEQVLAIAYFYLWGLWFRLRTV